MIRQNKGKRLVKVEVAPGVWMKVEGGQTRRSAPTGGARVEPPSPNPDMEKIIDVPGPTSPEVGTAPMNLDGSRLVDFTEIVGVGKATDQALHENGIHTFEDLLDADVSFLSKQGQKAVERWRAGL